MLETLAERGTAEERELARQALAISQSTRQEREHVAAATPRAARAAAGAAVKKRTIYSANNGTQLPGTKVRGEGDAATGDAAVDEAYDGAGSTFDLYNDIYSRNSIDNQGMELISTVHFGQNYNNAFWNGHQMTYGDGDGNLFNRFTIAIDIIGHEMTHGVVQHEANLVYQNQPGALNESFADVFGSLVKQRTLNQTAAQADWLIGAGLFTSNVNAQGIRSMKAPGTAYDDPKIGKDPQPAHMDDIYTGSADNGGVHINSGIPNHAFYVTAMEIGGYSWEKAGRIWYITLRDKLNQNSNFQDAANETYKVAGELYGINSAEQRAVRKGWQTVGIEIAALGWQTNRKVLYVYSTNASMVVYAIIEGVSGWLRIHPGSPDGVSNVMMVLELAKAFDRRVHVYVRNINNVNYITNAYLL
jgi:Zn-dependent metalloprotease